MGIHNQVKVDEYLPVQNAAAITAVSVVYVGNEIVNTIFVLFWTNSPIQTNSVYVSSTKTDKNWWCLEFRCSKIWQSIGQPNHLRSVDSLSPGEFVIQYGNSFDKLDSLNSVVAEEKKKTVH